MREHRDSIQNQQSSMSTSTIITSYCFQQKCHQEDNLMFPCPHKHCHDSLNGPNHGISATLSWFLFSGTWWTRQRLRDNHCDVIPISNILFGNPSENKGSVEFSVRMSVILIINQSTTILDDPGLDRDVMNECLSI